MKSRFLRVGIGWLIVSLIPIVGMAGEAPDFSFERAHGQTLETTNGVNLLISMPPGYALEQPQNRYDSFKGVPYAISLDAFFANDGAVMVHAERVRDGSGASDYSSLTPTTLSGLDFVAREAACIKVSKREIEGEHDLKWLKDRGFLPTGPLMYQQFFRTTPNHDNEVVISLLQNVPDCSNNEANQKTLSALKSNIHIQASE